MTNNNQSDNKQSKPPADNRLPLSIESVHAHGSRPIQTPTETPNQPRKAQVGPEPCCPTHGMVYHDPLTEKEPEGVARLIRRVSNSGGLEYWEVEFLAEKGSFHRRALKTPSPGMPKTDETKTGNTKTPPGTLNQPRKTQVPTVQSQVPVKTEDRARQLTYCMGCNKSKPKGLVVCWDCYKYRQDIIPFKYSGLGLEDWLLNLDKPHVQNQPKTASTPVGYKSIGIGRSNYAVCEDGRVFRVVRQGWLNSKDWKPVKARTAKRIKRALEGFLSRKGVKTTPPDGPKTDEARAGNTRTPVNLPPVKHETPVCDVCGCLLTALKFNPMSNKYECLYCGADYDKNMEGNQ